MEKLQLSICIPLYNEGESLPELYAWISKVMHQHHFSYELIFVDDGSSDNSWEIIERFAKENDAVKGIKFRRNYGKSAALFVAFKATQGDVVITMDGDDWLASNTVFEDVYNEYDPIPMNEMPYILICTYNLNDDAILNFNQKEEMYIEGIDTNTDLHDKIFHEKNFVEGNISINYLPKTPGGKKIKSVEVLVKIANNN